ncbi:hypothetical protein BH09SUM1_BH09SUM1_21130 [soil metagenome]
MKRVLQGLAWSLAATIASAQPNGIATRASNESLLIDDLPSAPTGTYTETRVFPQLGFQKAVLLIQAPDDSNRIFVVSQTGIIYTFPNIPNPAPADVSVFLNITDRVLDADERGLLGLAFDPDYATNGRLYIDYTRNSGTKGTSYVSRFTNKNVGGVPTPESNSVNASTEEILITVVKPYTNHNGGMIAFGPDRMLYIGWGDGGSGNDPENRAQDTTQFLGKILRIDPTSTPDVGLAYHIPSDNPFVNGGPAGASTKKEIFSYGMRNPYRFSFDIVNGYLMCGDVGQDAREEIDHVKSGGNYGWKIMEGTICRPGGGTCNQTGLILPISDYVNVGSRTNVTGGYVYYGSRVPGLYGTYLYADYGSKEIFGLRYNGSTATAMSVLSSGAVTPSGFGQTSDGEVYILDYIYSTATGGIYQLTPVTATPDNFPRKLSDNPALLAAGKGEDQTAAGIIPYEPAAKLWSDGAHKERFIAAPHLTQAGFTAADGWNMPDKTVIVKNFSLPLDDRNPNGSLKRIETRLLYFKNSEWNGFSYEWNDAQTDAVLLTGSKTRNFSITAFAGNSYQYQWYYPSTADCRACHTPQANGLLGITAPQLNHDFAYPASGVTDNELRALNFVSFFSQDIGDHAQYSAMPDPFGNAPVRDRARAYLAANCAQCHRGANDTAPGVLDLRWESADDAMNAISLPPERGDLGITGAQIIAPMNPELSVLLQRMNHVDGTRMPPLATSRVDQQGVALITEWINSLPVAGDAWMVY